MGAHFEALCMHVLMAVSDLGSTFFLMSEIPSILLSVEIIFPCNFSEYKGGIFSGCTNNEPDHAVVVVG